MKNKEIEIKLKISKQEYDTLKQLLKHKGTFIKKTLQQETYFSFPHKELIQSDGTIWEWFRLRVEGEKKTVTYKKVHRGEDNKGREKDEYEFTVSSPEQFKAMITALDFQILIEFQKERTIYDYKNNFEISLDYVEELGYFTEIELSIEVESIEEAINILEATINELNLNIKNESILGYPHLMLLHKGLAPKPAFGRN